MANVIKVIDRIDDRSEFEKRSDLFHLYNEFLKDERDNWECSFCQGAIHNTKPAYIEIRWDETWKLWGVVVIDDHPVISGPLHDSAEVPYFPTRDEALRSINREMINAKYEGRPYEQLNRSVKVYVHSKNGSHITKKYLFNAFESSIASKDVLIPFKGQSGKRIWLHSKTKFPKA
jgi:hypothetical protein|tara:strand:- start:9370 stop:9894 length:525 start_codon:yes stop_codon:yes gene_type:complete